MFQFGLVPATNIPTRLTKVTISPIDHIITNSIINSEFKTAILTADISDHFSIIYAFRLKTKLDIPKTQFSKSSHQRCSMKNDFLGNFTKFIGKHLCQSFPMNFVKFPRTPFLQNTSGRLLLVFI